MDQDYMDRMLQRYEDKMFRDEERWFFGDDEDDDGEEDLEYQLEQAEYYEER